MGRYLIEMFGVSLLLTVAMELPAAWLAGLRGKKYAVLVVLLNILTNPAAVLLCRLGVSQLLVELAVIAAEAWVYFQFSKEEAWKIPHPFYLSVVCNGLSWLSGVLLQMIGG